MSATLANAIARLQDAFPDQPFGDRSAVVYGEQLGDLDPVLVDEAVRRLVNVSRYMPRISEIRREVFEHTLGLPTPEEAWEMALDWSLAAESSRAAWTLPDEVRRSMKAIGGGWAIRHSDNPETLRAQFRKHYEGVRERAIRDAAAGEPIRPEQLKPGRAPQLPPAGAKDPKAKLGTESEVSSLAARKLRDIPVSTSIRPRR